MATIRFYGDLERFGRRFRLDVTTAAEAIRALCIQIPGLKQHLQQGHYRFRVARHDVSETSLQDHLRQPLRDGDVIHLVPVVGAAKSKYFSVVAGAVMIGVGLFTANPALVYAGIGMMVGGVATLLTPVPQTDSNSTNNGSGNKYFSSLGNTVAQGSCVPLVYGEVMVGSKVLSQGLRTG
ncbi:tail assembly protein [Photobacterium sp. MCCC 1A19761]|uniref:tail assembly protein n=1 Tax=Photobacterium sp. MCCC 1A19761 TaxID=3115000 RepID=UPI00307F226C